MKAHYEVSLVGSSHALEDKGCQDAVAVRDHDGYVILAVADGIGSQEHSEIGASVAADTCVSTCDRLIDSCDAESTLLDLLRTSFAEAYDAVLNKADELDLSASQMDCTLCCVIWDSVQRKAYIGQSGDSGAACAHGDGSYELLTEKQNDSEGAVFCLCFDDRWVFSEASDVWTVMLCTDGVLDSIVAPPALKVVADNEECNGGSLVDARMAHAFLHPYLNPEDTDPVIGLRSRAETYLAGYDPVLLYDDKTVAVAFDTESLPSFMDGPYYEGPDWLKVEAECHRLLYRQEEAPSELDLNANGSIAGNLELPPNPDGGAPDVGSSDAPGRDAGSDDGADQLPKSDVAQISGDLGLVFAEGAEVGMRVAVIAAEETRTGAARLIHRVRELFEHNKDTRLAGRREIHLRKDGEQTLMREIERSSTKLGQESPGLLGPPGSPSWL